MVCCLDNHITLPNGGIGPGQPHLWWHSSKLYHEEFLSFPVLKRGYILCRKVEGAMFFKSSGTKISWNSLGTNNAMRGTISSPRHVWYPCSCRANGLVRYPNGNNYFHFPTMKNKYQSRYVICKHCKAVQFNLLLFILFWYILSVCKKVCTPWIHWGKAGNGEHFPPPVMVSIAPTLWSYSLVSKSSICWCQR